MVLAAAVRQDGLMATTVTEGEPRELRMPFATSMRWQGKLATLKPRPRCQPIEPDRVRMRRVLGHRNNRERVFRTSNAYTLNDPEPCKSVYS